MSPDVGSSLCEGTGRDAGLAYWFSAGKREYIPYNPIDYLYNALPCALLTHSQQARDGSQGPECKAWEPLPYQALSLPSAQMDRKGLGFRVSGLGFQV